MADLETEKLIAEIKEQQLKTTKELAEANIRLKEAAGEVYQGRQKELEVMQSLIQEAQAMQDLVKGEAEEVRKRSALEAERIKKVLADQEEMLKISADDKKALEEKSDLLVAIAKLDDERIEALQKQGKAQLDNAKGMQAVITHAERVADALGNMTGNTEAWRGTLLGGFLTMEAGSVSFIDQLKEVGKSLRTQFNWKNILGSSAMKVQEATLAMAWAQSSAIASMEKATTSGGAYKDQIIDMSFTTRHLGIDAADLGAAYGALDSQLNGFRFMTEETQKSLGSLTGMLEKSGVAVSTTAANIDFMMGAMKLTAPQTEKLTKQLAGLADAVGESTSQMMEDFAKASKQLAHYGDRAAEVFAGIKGAAKAMRVDVSEALNFAEQFESFSGAAKMAAKTNMLLNGQFINPIEMMGKDADEVMRSMVSAIESSGRQAEFLHNKYWIKAFADNLGISKDFAAKMIGLGTAGFDEWQRKSKLQEKDTAKLAEQAQRAMDVVQSLKMMGMQFAIAITPFVDAIKILADGFGKVNEESGGLLGWIVSGFVAAVVIAKIYMGTLATIASIKAAGLLATLAGTAKETVASGARITALEGELAAQELLNASKLRGAAAGVDPAAAASAAAAGMMAKAAMIAAVGVAIAGVAAAIWLLVDAWRTLATTMKEVGTGPALAAGGLIVGLAVGFFFLAKALLAVTIPATFAAKPLLVIGAVILAMGLGVYLLALGFVTLGDGALKAAGAFFLMSAGVTVLAAGMFILAKIGTIATAGLIAMAVGLTAVAIAVALIKTADLTALGNMFKGLGQIAEAGGVKLAGLKTHVKELAALAEDMEGKKINTYIQFANATEKIGFAGEKISAPALRTKYAPRSAGSTAQEEAAAPMTTSPRGGRTTAAADKNQYTFYLQIGDQEFTELTTRAVRRGTPGGAVVKAR